MRFLVGSNIGQTICKQSALCSEQITAATPHHLILWDRSSSCGVTNSVKTLKANEHKRTWSKLHCLKNICVIFSCNRGRGSTEQSISVRDITDLLYDVSILCCLELERLLHAGLVVTGRPSHHKHHPDRHIVVWWVAPRLSDDHPALVVVGRRVHVCNYVDVHPVADVWTVDEVAERMRIRHLSMKR